MRKPEHILEEYLVASAKLGDRGALARLFELRGPRLQAHASRLLGDVEQARDAVQDAWVEILRGLPNLKENRAFASWAYQITSRRCARIIKGLQKDRVVGAAVSTEAETVTQSVGAESADARVVREALSKLPPEQSATIALFYLEDMSVAEVSKALDIPIGTVKTRLMHARLKLRETLKGALDEEA